MKKTVTLDEAKVLAEEAGWLLSDGINLPVKAVRDFDGTVWQITLWTSAAGRVTSLDVGKGSWLGRPVWPPDLRAKFEAVLADPTAR